MSWLDAAPTFFLLVTVMYLPGWGMLRLLGVRGRLGIAWSVASVTVTMLIATAGVAVVARFLPKRRIRTSPLPLRDASIISVGLLVGALLQAAAYVPGMRRPDALHQIHDALFQLNAAQAILRSGDASSFGALDALQAHRTGAFYPIAYDAIAAVGAPVSSAVAAVNVLMLITILVIWPIGTVALARVVAPGRPLVAAVAPVIAASFIIFPANFIVMQGALPYGLALALAPGTAALVIAVIDDRVSPAVQAEPPVPVVGSSRPPEGRTPGSAMPAAAIGADDRSADSGHQATWPAGLLVVLISVAGVAAAHPSGIAVLAVYLLPKLAEVATRSGRRLRDQGRMGLAWFIRFVVPGLLLILLASLFLVPTLRAMTTYQEAEGDAAAALLRGFTSSTTVGSSSAWANSVVAILLVIGLVDALAHRRTRWFGYTWLLVLMCYVLASGPEFVLRGLTGFWYKSAERTQAMLPTVTSILAAMGALVVATACAEFLQSAVRRRQVSGGPVIPDRTGVLTALGVVTILLIAYWSSGQFRLAERRDEWTAWGFQADHLIHPPYVTDDELVMIRSLPGLLPPDAVVLGDPFSGAPFVQGVAGLIAYIPHVNPTSWDADQEFLMQHFADIRTDPRVCEIVRSSGIGYFYWDVDNEAGWTAQSPGLSQVDTRDGFELVAAANTAKVFRITACG
jgi:hypothetical protein